MDEFNTTPSPLPDVADTQGTDQNTTENGSNTDLDDLSQGQALYKILVDGVEEEYDLDTLKKMASHGKGADKRMSEAGRLKQDTTKLLELLRQDPIAVRKELDKEFSEKKFLTERLAALMNEEMMTPAQKQQAQDARELQDYRESRRKEQEDIQQKELQATVNVEIQKLDVEFAQAFEEVGLPKTDEARRRLATIMLQAAENGQNIPTNTLAKFVKDEMHKELMALLSTSDDASFEALLGSDLLSKAQKLSLKKIKKPGNSVTPGAIKRDVVQTKPKGRTRDDFLGDLGMF